MQAHHPIALIIGLANPGSRYAETRHNAGSWFVEALSSEYNVPLKSETKFHGLTGQITVGTQTVRLLIPTTFMNDSGKAVQAITQFYKIAPENILVAYDDIDLPVGVVRLKHSGGAGGHNGLRSLDKHLGTKDFNRLRIGVGHPGHKREVTNYVLGVPSLDDKISIMRSLDSARGMLDEIIQGEFEKAMNFLHSGAS